MWKRLTHRVPAAVLLTACFLLPATSASGQNYALDFVNDRVDIPYIGTGVSFAEISLEAFVYWRGHSGSEGVSGIIEGRGSTLHWQINANNNVRIRLEGVDQNASANVQKDEWFHLAVTYNRATKELKCYKNGTVFHTFSGDSNTDTFWTSGYAQIGTSHRAGDRRWNGMIDEFCIWNKVRTQEQVQANMKNGLVGTEPGLIAYWKFNEGEGTTAFDSSPNKNDATIVGATWVNLSAASNPSPANAATGVNNPLLQWKPAPAAVFHNVYFGTTPDLTEANLVAAQQPFALYFHVPGFQPGVTYYWRVDEIEADMVTIRQGAVWSFTTEPLTAFAPKPADGAGNLMPAPTLTWQQGKGAIKHRVYFSNNLSEVESGAAAANKGDLTEKTFKPGVLRSSTTYHWRVDEIKVDGSVEQGPVWSFTTAGGVAKKVIREWWTGIAGTAIAALTGSANYPGNPTGSELLDAFEGPTTWADNYGSRIYGWLTPPQSGDYTFWIASDDLGELWLSTDADPAKANVIARVATYTTARQWDKEAGQKSAAIKLQAGQKYFIMAIMKEGTGGDNLAVSWQGPGVAAQEVIKADYVDTFALPPLQAFGPSPANGAVDAPQDGALSWNAGEQAQNHEVYFGDDAAAVAAADKTSPLFKGNQAGTTFDAGDLEWGKTYHWRVDEVGAAETWKGTVWSFTTANFLPIDDMESYTDDEGGRIYEFWIDGYADKSSGSVVGYLQAPFAERTIVHGGKQSMPMEYDNSKAPYYSEAELEFSPLQNWTANGVTNLVLYARGYAAAAAVAVAETGGKMSVTGAGADIWNNSDEFTYAYKALTGDGTLVARVTNIGVGSNTWAKGGVMIRDSLNGGSTHAMMVLTANSDGTAGNGASFQYRAAANGASANADSGSLIKPPYWVKIERAGDTLTGYVSADGKAWNMLGTTIIAMQAPVYIGLCVTSHAAGQNRTFDFDSISSTGGVSGAWQGAVISAPVHNSTQPLYVRVEDSAGKKAVATNADAVTAATWTEVKIPLSSFAGVNLSKVKKLVVGVGDPANPAADGSGRIFVDDIRVIRP